MKKYTFIYEDKEGNELQRKDWFAENKKAARKLAKEMLATSMINDLKKIKVL